VTTRRLLALGGAVTALLVVAGIASHGRPLSGGDAGRGPSATFFDYLATTLVLVACATAAVFLWAVVTQRTGRKPVARSPWYLVSTLATLVAAAVIGSLILQSDFGKRLAQRAADFATKQQQADQKPQAAPRDKEVRDPKLRWDEIAIVLALLGATAVVVYATRRGRPTARSFRLRREDVVSFALDESLDDLRDDPDLRRAIVAAYARMERALAAVGLARRPSEAPFEYMERALRSLDTSADAAERLTALFEWAKFSQHEPGPEMRDEAIDALVAVRDELRAPAVAA